MNNVVVSFLLVHVHNILSCAHVDITDVAGYTIGRGYQSVHLIPFYGCINNLPPIFCLVIIILFNSVSKLIFKTISIPLIYLFVPTLPIITSYDDQIWIIYLRCFDLFDFIFSIITLLVSFIVINIVARCSCIVGCMIVECMICRPLDITHSWIIYNAAFISDN